MRDLATISTCSDASTNLDDGNFYFDIDYMMFHNPRKLGRGSRRLGSRGWKLHGNTAPAMLRSCSAIALKSSAWMDHNWVQRSHRLLLQTPRGRAVNQVST